CFKSKSTSSSKIKTVLGALSLIHSSMESALVTSSEVRAWILSAKDGRASLNWSRDKVSLHEEEITSFKSEFSSKKVLSRLTATGSSSRPNIKRCDKSKDLWKLSELRTPSMSKNKTFMSLFY